MHIKLQRIYPYSLGVQTADRSAVELTVSVSPRGVRHVMFVLAMMWLRYSRRSKILVLIAT
jgi:hypothetical protein